MVDLGAQEGTAICTEPCGRCPVIQNPDFTQLPAGTADALIAASLASEGSMVYPLQDGNWMASHRGQRSSDSFPTREAAQRWVDTLEALYGDRS
jgi:hypothetical protein